jgi:hypothetical protein
MLPVGVEVGWKQQMVVGETYEEDATSRNALICSPYTVMYTAEFRAVGLFVENLGW